MQTQGKDYTFPPLKESLLYFWVLEGGRQRPRCWKTKGMILTSTLLATHNTGRWFGYSQLNAVDWNSDCWGGERKGYAFNMECLRQACALIACSQFGATEARGSAFSGTSVLGSHESPDKIAGDQTWVLWKSSTSLKTKSVLQWDTMKIMAYSSCLSRVGQGLSQITFSVRCSWQPSLD